MAKIKQYPVPPSREGLRPVDKAFIYTIMFEFGILPIEDPVLDMRVPLRQLAPEQARIVKRKFRKLWRKLVRDRAAHMKNKSAAGKHLPHLSKMYGIGKQQPSRAEKLERKRLVFEQIWEQHIVPMLQKFENPERAPPQE